MQVGKGAKTVGFYGLNGRAYGRGTYLHQIVLEEEEEEEGWGRGRRGRRRSPPLKCSGFRSVLRLLPVSQAGRRVGEESQRKTRGRLSAGARTRARVFCTARPVSRPMVECEFGGDKARAEVRRRLLSRCWGGGSSDRDGVSPDTQVPTWAALRPQASPGVTLLVPGHCSVTRPPSFADEAGSDTNIAYKGHTQALQATSP